MAVSSKTLKLFCPQWQGAANPALYHGAQLLYSALQDSPAFKTIATPLTYSLATHNSVVGQSQLVTQAQAAHHIIDQIAPARIVTIGGDCGVELTPVSFLKRQYGQDFAVLWLDAHADLNTPQSSPSGHFHGMPLRALLGEGDAAILKQAFSFLNAEQVYLVGTRELDRPEAQFVSDRALPIFSAMAINRGNFDSLFTTLQQTSCKQLYIHLDLDVLDSDEFLHTACPSPRGVSSQGLIHFLNIMNQNFEIVGFSLLEFMPRGDRPQALAQLVELIAQVHLPFPIFDPSSISSA